MSEIPSTPASGERTVRHTIRREAGSTVVLDVEVAAHRLARQTDRVFERRNRQARIPGFRPGKAPRAMYERTYGTEHLLHEAAEDLVDETYREILDEDDLSPIDQPNVEITELTPTGPLKYTAKVIVRPSVLLGDYQAHGVTVAPAPATDDEIRRTIDLMRESHAQLRPVDREARAGDVVTADIDVTVDGRRLPSFARNAHLEAGKSIGIPGLGEALVGIGAAGTKAVDLAVPAQRGRDAAKRREDADKSGENAVAESVEDAVAQGGEDALSGKTGTFEIRVSQVAEKSVPALDDDFAKTVGVANVEELRRTVKNELAHASFHEARDTAAEKMLDHVLASAQVEIPELLVHDELDHLVSDLKSRVREQGLTYEQFLVQARKTEDDIRKDWRPMAERRAKSLLVLDEIAKREGISVSSTELAEQAAMTPLARQAPEALRDPLVLASLARSIRNRKVVDQLIGLGTPEAEREAIQKAGGEVEAQPAKPEIIVPPTTDATPQGREAIRALLKKK